MRAGGADPSAVLDIISDNVLHAPTAEQRDVAAGIVQALEVGGYRIVRAGMVPQLDALFRSPTPASQRAARNRIDRLLCDWCGMAKVTDRPGVPPPCQCPPETRP